jgi:hypothetical protein
MLKVRTKAMMVICNIFVVMHRDMNNSNVIVMFL